MPNRLPTAPAAIRPGSVIGARSSFNTSSPGQDPDLKRSHNDAFRKSIILNGASQAVANRAAASKNSVSPSDLNTPVRNTHILNQPGASGSVCDPSNAPGSSINSSSTIDTKRQRRDSGSGTHNHRHVSGRVHIKGICKISGRSRRAYRIGDILAMPFHYSNLNPDVQPGDPCLTDTNQTPVYSKRRMVIVLWIHEQDMFCLPIYTFQGSGLRNKPPHLIKEYICLKNWGDNKHRPQGDYDAVEGWLKRTPIHAEAVVHLSGGLRVACADDLSFSGRMMEGSYYQLLEHWKDLTHDARKERCGAATSIINYGRFLCDERLKSQASNR